MAAVQKVRQECGRSLSLFAIEIVQFPLTFCVLPALLIVFLGPPLLSLVN